MTVSTPHLTAKILFTLDTCTEEGWELKVLKTEAKHHSVFFFKFMYNQDSSYIYFIVFDVFT